MPRKPTKPKEEGLTKVTLMLPSEDVDEIDKEAERLSKDDPFGRAITRTDIVRSYIRQGLAKKK